MTLSGLRVLLAEDNPTNQLVATQMLESLGASVLLTEDGVEALELVGREPVDVMLVDIEMPRVNGIEVMRRLRSASSPIAELPMIALTAYVMRKHRAAIDAAGADGVIAKPILSIEQFGANILRYMRKRTGAGAPGAAVASPGDVPAGACGGERPVIDRAIYDSLANTVGATAMAQVLEKAESDIRAARERLAKALDPLELGEVRAVTHILISVAGAVGAVPLQHEAKRLNEAAHRGDAAEVEADMPGLVNSIDRLCQFFRAQAEG